MRRSGVRTNFVSLGGFHKIDNSVFVLRGQGMTPDALPAVESRHEELRVWASVQVTITCCCIVQQKVTVTSRGIIDSNDTPYLSLMYL